MWPFDRFFRFRTVEPPRKDAPERIYGRIELVEWEREVPSTQTWTGEQLKMNELVRLFVWAANGNIGDCRFTLTDQRDEPLIIGLLRDTWGCREGKITNARARACKAYHPQARVFVQRGDFPGYCFVLVSTDPAPRP